MLADFQIRISAPLSSIHSIITYYSVQISVKYDSSNRQFKSNRKRIDSSSGTRDFQNNPPFERSTCFYVTIKGNFQRFQHFNLETDFLEHKNLFEKTGEQFIS